ncbi:Cytochrome P450 monooxygenase rdc4 [Lasiodiplodia hormozganensis]|uniref:Cytochrome P450 monooxygenase rdc4 n=1 Tax=Lasiodiplodia hormozganensis TaxID=869390 RepID=A0AA39WVW5_9PEZI|nr:Cytochrome P450 monooxygenase rdc4 [Lasiodiplodia hormozganensis]
MVLWPMQPHGPQRGGCGLQSAQIVRHPGPKIAAATTFTYYIISCQGRIVPWTQQVHEKYGEVVRVGPDRLSYISAQAWKDIYGHRTAKRPENPKDTRLYVKAVNGEHTIISVPDARDHGSIRKIFSNAFSDKALKLQEPLIQKYVDKLILNIQKEVNAQPSTELDLVMLYNCTTFDIMGDLAFGEPLGLLEQSGYTPWVKAIFKSIKAAQFLRIGLEFPLLGKIIEKLIMPQSLLNKRKEHFQYSADRVDRRMEKGTDKPDIWNLVLKNGTGQLSTGEMHSNAATFMLAGTETTATLLSGLTYHLLKNPDKMERLVKEVRSLSEDDLSLENLPRMPYLSACFEEGLRCYPPVPSALFREVADGGNQICGQWIPPKTRVGVTQFAAFHSPLNFKDPNSFVPERWLPGTGYDSDKKDAMQPFSVGPRNCLGKNLAYHEMRIILAKVLWNFNLELCPQSDSWADQECYILWEKPGLFVRAKPIR